MLQKADGVTTVVAMHWPPMVRDGRSGFSDLLEVFRVPLCLYRHPQGEQSQFGPVWNVRGGVRYQLVAADNTCFAPMPLELP